MTTIPFSPTTQETDVGLRRIALFAGGIAITLASVTAIIAVRFVAYGLKHEGTPAIDQVWRALGF